VSHRKVIRGSDRSFGRTLAAVFTIIGCIRSLPGNCILHKAEQNQNLKTEYKHAFELD
jgi:hypothetical protein